MHSYVEQSICLHILSTPRLDLSPNFCIPSPLLYFIVTVALKEDEDHEPPGGMWMNSSAMALAVARVLYYKEGSNAGLASMATSPS